MLRASTDSIRLPERYRVTGRIAAGGMAEVWAAHDEVLDRPVAVKVLASHLSADPVARRRFEREARAAAGLSSHPSVVTIFDVGQTDERSFIVMELRDGGTLAEVVRAGRPVDPGRALSWLREAADALDAAHERGVVHRDIKPANLLLDRRGHLAVADFGIARLAWETTQMTATGQVLGTAAYLSPEQALGEPATAASDRYALAVVAYELLAGSRLFPHAEHFTAQARAHIEDPPVPPSARNPALPVAVDEVLLRGLAKDPARRWPTATAMVDALASALREREAATPAGLPWAGATTATVRLASGVARAAGAGAAAGASRTLQMLRPPATPVPRQPRSRVAPRQNRVAPERSKRSRLVPVVGLILAFVAVVALAMSSGGDSDRRTSTPKQPTTAASQPSPSAPAPAPPAATPSGTPAQLNDRGYALFQQGRYDDSLPLFKAAVRGCGNSRSIDPCGYALYNLGASLHRLGRSQEAIPILVRRLRRFGDNESGDVRRELAAAIRAEH